MIKGPFAVLLSALAFAGTAHASPFVYVSDPDPVGGHPRMSEYRTGPFGTLQSIAQFPLSEPAGPSDIAITRDGRSAYVSDYEGIRELDIRPNGKLSPKQPEQLPLYDPDRLALSPDDKHLYVAQLFRYQIDVFDVGPHGVLSGPTSVTPLEGGPGDLVASPDGHSLYATNELGTSVSAFDIGPGGALSPKTPSAVAAGDAPIGIAIDRTGRNVYVVAVSSGWVAQYTVGAGGALTPKSPATVPAGFAPIDIALSPDGHNAYVTNQGDDNISQYDIALDGRLTPKSPATVGAGDVPQSPVVSPDGRNLYVANYNGKSVGQYRIGAGGALVHLPKDVPAGRPTGIGITESSSHIARQACLFERAAHGAGAFRAKYGAGRFHLFALARCISARLAAP
jgi:DNA-binding beta-propeller fold protein YncE